MKKALLFESLDNNRVRCRLCAHYCVIAPGRRGICQVRENRNGVLYTLVYGRTISRNVDPIEKKPLYHFLPGSRAFSIAAPGCNFHCDWCQNWEISQQPREGQIIAGQELAPEAVVKEALAAGCRSVAYTYTEPTVFFEYCLDTARCARDNGLRNVFISNGYMSAEMLAQLHPWLDAANIDLKAFRDTTYQRFAGGRLQPVLDNLKRLHDYGIWTEVTTLLIPGLNDSAAELRELAEFMVRELGPETPWHVSRFFPQYKQNDRPPTPPQTILEAVEIGRAAGLQYIYPGNLAQKTQTRCPGCGAVLIERDGFRVGLMRVTTASCCPECGAQVGGIWGDAGP
ncbi:AmmeMemoRadiSam system radical SAM enzyme [Pelobacter seleniigenes]|uniref:AmmeMemoRadiSam system radical SAM enzyme n=1 Tax=Pelobacter seleniigenes TaxID=407188 RepID=UPI0004A78439|nr:AmmeMemoRadiSam system radical SAM enzyme [Pelobacter seleniigenes]